MNPPLSKREWMASQALLGILSSNVRMLEGDAEKVLAISAVMAADALLAELARTELKDCAHDFRTHTMEGVKFSGCFKCGATLNGNIP